MMPATTIAEVREFVARRRHEGHVIAFVPTMGCLHEGHLSLIREARRRAAKGTGQGTVVVSIFVNPLQFGPGEDYQRYPRDLERDAAMAREEGVDLLFYPSVQEMYPDGQTLTWVDVERLNQGLCGDRRPGHFRGVATVVAKLLNIVQPDVAVFGEKDYQQSLVIRRMVRDLNFPVEIVVAPTVREGDGLALSSRNTYLAPEERRAATVLYRALNHARELVAQGERDPRSLERAITELFAGEPLARADYVAVVDADDLTPLADLRGRKVLVALAVFVGQTRLIDNTILEVPA